MTVKYPNIDKMSDKELMLETRIMEIGIEGNEFLPELIVELRLRGFVDEDDHWTQKANEFDYKDDGEGN